MSKVKFVCIPSQAAKCLQRGGLDANGQLPERQISDGQGNPCRHCLRMIEKGKELLVLSYKPFDADQPYAERGPIFLHGEECSPFVDCDQQPEIFEGDETKLIRGYDDSQRIVYGTGKVVANSDIREEAINLLNDKNVTFVHVRSATNNCYQARIERKDEA